jgi:hypothetical protein
MNSHSISQEVVQREFANLAQRLEWRLLGKIGKLPLDNLL